MIEKTDNKRKYILATLFSLLLLALCFLFVATPVMSVYATSTDVREQYITDTNTNVTSAITDFYKDTTLVNTQNNQTLADSIYTWTAGTSVYKNDVSKLVFRLELTNANSEVTTHSSSFSFDLHKCNADGTTTTIPLTILIHNSTNNNQIQTGVGIKRNTYTDTLFGISSYANNITNDTQQTEIASYTSNQSVCNVLSDNNCSMVSFFTQQDTSTQNTQLLFSGSTRQFIYIIADVGVDDYYSNYFVKFNYSINGTNNSLCSSINSVYSVLNKMSAMDGITSLDTTNQTLANTIIENGSIQQVQVSYLKQIGDTPFAEKKTAYVSVPVIQGNIRPSDVCEELELDTLAVMQSPCQYFTYDSANDIYNAYYLQSVWLSSKDANGHYVNYFLDINKNYRQYYYSFVEDDVYSLGLYNWFWSQMINKYPAIAPYMDYQLYGYFGYAVVPDTYTISQLFYEMFDGSPNYDGIVQSFTYNELIDYDSYMTLLDDYQYGWLSKAWNTVIGGVSGSTYSASHYLFYVDDETTEAMIAQNGADDINDNSSHLWNTTEDVVDDVLDTFGNLFDKYGDIFKVVFGVLGIFILAFLFLIILCRVFKTKSAINEYKASKRIRKRRR